LPFFNQYNKDDKSNDKIGSNKKSSAQEKDAILLEKE